MWRLVMWLVNIKIIFSPQWTVVTQKTKQYVSTKRQVNKAILNTLKVQILARTTYCAQENKFLARFNFGEL